MQMFFIYKKGDLSTFIESKMHPTIQKTKTVKKAKIF